MAGDTCQKIIHKKPDGGLSAVGGNSIYNYYEPNDPKYADLLAKLNADVPELLTALGLEGEPLPLLWTADYIPKVSACAECAELARVVRVPWAEPACSSTRFCSFRPPHAQNSVRKLSSFISPFPRAPPRELGSRASGHRLCGYGVRRG